MRGIESNDGPVSRALTFRILDSEGSRFGDSSRHKGRSVSAKSVALCNQKLVQLGNLGVTLGHSTDSCPVNCDSDV
jgi:hypothetical protein